MVFWIISTVISIYRKIITGQNVAILEYAKGLIIGGHWLEVTGNFPLWFLHLLFIAIIIFGFWIRFFPKGIVIVLAIVNAISTLWFQELFPGRPAYHINVLPCALVYMTVGYYTYIILKDKKLNLSFGIVLLAIGWYLQQSHGGNISQINSYWYYASSLCSITGIYVVAQNLKGSHEIMKKSGKMSLYIMGIHSMLIDYAAQFTQYLFDTLLISSDFLKHMFIAVTTFVLSYALSEIYMTLKAHVIERKLFQNS